MRGLEGVWRGASRHQCLIIYRPEKSTCILPPIPNHLSTYQLHQSYHSLFGEYDGAGGVEKMGLEGVWRGENGVHLDTNA